VVTDRNDTRGKVDISAVRGAHNRVRDQLVHSIRAYDAFAPLDLRNTNGPPGAICVNIWTTRTPGETLPNYEVCVTSDRKAQRFEGTINRFGRGASVRRVGTARLERPSSKQLRIRFDPDRIRRPESYRWSVQATTHGGACRSPTGCEDLAPNTPRTVRTDLGEPRS
jgi:hypothetical protein